eukprot:3561623-Prymnesium_polylepis.1
MAGWAQRCSMRCRSRRIGMPRLLRRRLVRWSAEPKSCLDGSRRRATCAASTWTTPMGTRRCGQSEPRAVDRIALVSQLLLALRRIRPAVFPLAPSRQTI